MLARTDVLELLLDQQDEFVALLLQGAVDVDPCCSPFAERTEASAPSLCIICTDGKTEPTLVLPRNRLSALKIKREIKRENSLVQELMALDMTMVGSKSRLKSIDDYQIFCRQESLPPPMPFVRNSLDRAILFVETSLTRREYNFRVGLLLHAERLKLLKRQHLR